MKPNAKKSSEQLKMYNVKTKKDTVEIDQTVRGASSPRSALIFVLKSQWGKDYKYIITKITPKNVKDIPAHVPYVIADVSSMYGTRQTHNRYRVLMTLSCMRTKRTKDNKKETGGK